MPVKRMSDDIERNLDQANWRAAICPFRFEEIQNVNGTVINASTIINRNEE